IVQNKRCVLLPNVYNSILSFHRFPVDEEVKSVWTAKIRREDFSPTDGTRVCSVHFLPGDFVGPRRLKKDAVPCLFAWNKFSIPTPRLNVWQRHPRPPTPELLPSEEEDSVQPMEVTVTDHDYCVTPNTSVVVYELTRENEKLREKIEQLQHQLESLQLRSTFGLQRIAGSDEDIRFYTRFVYYTVYYTDCVCVCVCVCVCLCSLSDSNPNYQISTDLLMLISVYYHCIL
uniref:THAP-type domain-containing protein n=1 Tax=Sander lucioperca TaxID=283035 RepID=A0A8C9XEZ2_SANLU